MSKFVLAPLLPAKDIFSEERLLSFKGKLRSSGCFSPEQSRNNIKYYKTQAHAQKLSPDRNFMHKRLEKNSNMDKQVKNFMDWRMLKIKIKSQQIYN